MILDATAGNRHMWGDNKYPEGVVFLDKEPGLRIPADVVTTWDHIPYPDNYFHCIIFDPPHVFSETSQFNRDPKARPNGCKRIPGWYGAFKSERDAATQIYKGQREFARVSPRLCMKWNEASMSIDKVLSLFDCWEVKYLFSTSRGNKPKTYWVKMIRKSHPSF